MKNTIRTYTYTVWIYAIDCVIEKTKIDEYKLTISIDYDEIRYLESENIDELKEFSYWFCEWFETMAWYIKANL